jgi:hypothetical protein
MRSQQLQQEQQQQWQADRRIGMISIAMWIGTAMRVLPFLTFWENMQSVVAISTSKCFVHAAVAWCLAVGYVCCTCVSCHASHLRVPVSRQDTAHAGISNMCPSL